MNLKKSSNSLPYVGDSTFTFNRKNPLHLQSSPTIDIRKLSSPRLSNSKKELQQLLDPSNSDRKEIKNVEINMTERRKHGKFINLPDFYIGSNLKTGFREYSPSNLSKLMEIYNKNIKKMDEIDSKNFQLSRETYYSGYEQEIMSNLKLSARDNQRKDQICGFNEKN